METGEVWQIGLYALAVVVVLAVMLGLPALLGERHWNKPERRQDIATAVPYECGIKPTGSAQIRLPIQYYLVAMFFVIFDLESVFLYAWAVAVRGAARGVGLSLAHRRARLERAIPTAAGPSPPSAEGPRGARCLGGVTAGYRGPEYGTGATGR
jgi:NADH:ubiquinone oxidoreductase subunit 3 (subunit A)